MRPMSLRARSISITCSARSLGSLISSASMAWSFSGVAPRGRGPARGRVVAEVGLDGLVLVGGGAARPGAGQRTDGDLGAGFGPFLAHQDFGAGAHHMEVAKVIEVHVRRG